MTPTQTPDQDAAQAAWLEALYSRINGDEDSRVCKDIPEAACRHQPRNFFAYLLANLLAKVADEIASAKLVLPWLFGALGVPALFTAFLVPIREAGVLLPQLLVAALIRRLPVRKGVWILGALLSGFSLLGMAWAALHFQGGAAGALILLGLVIFSLARGLCSVAAKDVLGKTVSKGRRGALMGWSAGLGGLAVLGIGLWLSLDSGEGSAGLSLYAILLAVAGLLWLPAALAFAAIREQPGATAGGGNAISVALAQLGILRSDAPFRRFVITRALLLSVALAPPFYVLLAQQQAQAGLLGLGALIIANGLAGSLSAPFWGYWGDRSSRWVMAAAAAGAGILSLFVFIAHQQAWHWATGELGMAIIFLILTVMHGGVRLGRKIYLVDLGRPDTRAAYVAVSNTLIGVLMLAAGLLGLLADQFGVAPLILLLGLGALGAAGYSLRLPEVSAPDP